MIGTINKILQGIFGNKSNKQLAELQPIIDKIHSFENEYEQLSIDQVRQKTSEFKQRIADHLSEGQNKIDALQAQADEADINVYDKEKIYDEIDAIEKDQDQKLEDILEIILPEAFAVLKETAKRFTNSQTIEVTASEHDKNLATSAAYVDISGDKAIWNTTWDAAGSEVKWEMIHYDVQLIGGYALHKGKVAEMQTGEGKTLVATLPMYLNALAGRGVHLVTVNDYLARRDSEWMAPIFEFHGLHVDCIDKYKPNSPQRSEAYKADITYGTNNEFGFDYLRDNMAGESNGIVQRKHHYAIVDEVDSVLIDDARTPLIISGPTPKGDQQLFDELKPKVQQLFTAQKNLVTKIFSDAKKVLVSGTTDKAELKEANILLFRSYRGLPKNKALIKFLSEDGMKAQMQKTENYYMGEQNKHMPEIDSELYFVIDEKANSIDLTEKGINLISGADDVDFFIMPDISTELNALESSSISDQEKVDQKEAIIRDYSIKSERIHTINQLLKAYTLFEKDVDYVVMGGKVQIVDEQTGRIMDGRRYSDGLHQAIESKEAVKVEAATQTYASVTLQNYFRMYHKLSGMTGTAETEASELWDIYKLDVSVIPTNRPIQRKDEQDKVYRTKREKYNAIIEEVTELSNAGRPVLVGTTSVEVSELLSKMLTLKKINHQVLNAKLHQKEADIVAMAGKSGTVTIATNMAGRGTDIKLSAEVKAAGGLAIVGSEKHDSRRVDRQLRGRSGRQGDPGSSQFYLSLEDNLMRLFGSERVASIMDRLGLEEGEVIQHSMITKSIERAQKKVEENNFGIRKRLLEYDDVLNAQREVIYKRRRHALYGERLRVDIANMFQDAAGICVENYHPVKDFTGFKLDVLKIFGTDTRITESEFTTAKVEEIIEKLENEVWTSYKNKNEGIAKTTFPVIKDVFEKQQSQYKNIVVPFTDGLKALQVPVNLENAYKSEGKDVALELEKRVVLSMIDDEWKEHLREMDQLRQSVQFASHEQKDPLLIYKFESFQLFKAMINRLNNDVVSFLMRASLPVNAEAQQEAPKQQKNIGVASRPGQATQTANSAAHTNTAPQKSQPVVAEEKIGRNDACPCGSGKKYKQCHGKG